MLALFATLMPARAGADWPMNRHDAQRLGSSMQRAEIARPAPRWRRYMGGSVSALLAIDASPANVGREVVFISGGRLIARRADDAPLWQTPLLGLRGIVAQADLDGDGAEELLVTGSPGFLGVFSSRDGSLRWSAQSRELFGASIGAVRLVDLDGDGTREVYAADAACGSAGSDRAHVFSFARGFGSGRPDALTQRSSLESGRDYPCGVHDVVVDLEGDGRPEVVAFGSGHAYVFDGVTGRKRDSGLPAPALGGYALGFTLPYGSVTTHVVDVDGDGREEIVGLTNNGYEPSVNSRQLFVLGWDPARPAATRLSVRWRQTVSSVVTDRHLFAPQVVTDLDADRRPELVSAFTVVSGTAAPVTTTFVYRASDGGVLARVPGAEPRAVLASASGPALLVARDGVLEGYRFATFAGSPAPVPRFRIDDAQVLTWRDPQRSQHDDGGVQPITWSLADGTTVFFTVNASRTRIARWNLSSDDRVTRAAVLELAPSTALSVAPQQDVSGAPRGLLLGRSDGVVVVLDEALRPLNLGDDRVALRGVLTGGFDTGGCGLGYTPVTAARAGVGDAVFATDSRGVLVALDPAGASLVVPPTVRWEFTGGYYPTVLRDAAGALQEVVVAQLAGSTGLLRSLVSLRAGDGISAWRWSLGARDAEFLFTDAVPLRDASGRVDRLAVGSGDRADSSGRVYVVNVDGTARAETAPIMTLAIAQGQPSALDVTGDGSEDVLAVMAQPLRAFDGRTAQLLGEGPAALGWTAVVVRGLERRGAVDVLTTASYRPPAGLAVGRAGTSVTLQSQWSAAVTETSSYCGAAVVTCPDGLRMAGAFASSSDLFVVDVATGALRGLYTLAGGVAYVRGAAPTDARPVLGNVNGSPALVGGRAAFLVGSSDGYLYALDACSGGPMSPVLLWSRSFDSPVGEPVLADTDGDGRDEVLVSTGDGYLQALDAERFVAPAWVYDTDPDAGFAEVDVDEVRGPALHALWSAVPGAVRYEWALFTVRGAPVTRNPADPTDPFVAAEPGSLRATVRTGLVAGARYVFVVRAFGAGSLRSAETLSDGVTWLPDVVVEPSPDAGPGDDVVRPGCDGSVAQCHPDLALEGRAGPLGRCSCRAAGADARAGARGIGVAVLMLVGGALALRRGRRGRRSARRARMVPRT